MNYFYKKLWINPNFRNNQNYVIDYKLATYYGFLKIILQIKGTLNCKKCILYLPLSIFWASIISFILFGPVFVVVIGFEINYILGKVIEYLIIVSIILMSYGFYLKRFLKYLNVNSGHNTRKTMNKYVYFINLVLILPFVFVFYLIYKRNWKIFILSPKLSVDSLDYNLFFVVKKCLFKISNICKVPSNLYFSFSGDDSVYFFRFIENISQVLIGKDKES